MTDILSYWPDPSKQIRTNQKTALEWIEANIHKSKYLVMELPVGAGKSLIGITTARYLESNAYVLTPQRVLQKQYEDDFAHSEQLRLSSLYGKSNYQCQGKGTNCEVGSSIKPKCQFCPHKTAREKAISSSITVLNYDLALLNFALTETFSSRKLMILDECHSLEQVLTEFDAISITYNQMIKMNVKWAQISDIAAARKWAMEVYKPALQREMDLSEPIVKSLRDDERAHLTPDEVDLLKEYDEMSAQMDNLLELELISIEGLTSNYVLVHDKLNVKFKRLFGGTTFNKYIKPKAEKFLFMSATIPNYTEFCKDNGIPPEEATFLSLPSDFPEENRPVFFMPQMKMTKDWNADNNKANRKKMLRHIEDICEMHEKENGIIHTANFKIAEWLVEELKVSHQIFHHNPDSGDDRNAIIAAFQKSKKPSLLISPSITEGLDLKDDLARFAIIAKVPFPFLGDQWVFARQQLSAEWYRRQALISTIQGGGRVVRSNTDHGYVYILDESWKHLYDQSKAVIPTWWKEGYRVME